MCVQALGRERVTGVLMPNAIQADIDVAVALCAHLGIKNYTVNIENAYKGVIDELYKTLPDVTRQTRINLQPRLRMSVLYAVSQSLNGRVASTSNLSEEYVGYTTRYGDLAGDFAPIARLTVGEIKAVGRTLALPGGFVDKTPIDGLTDKSDEESLGFTYEVLDKFIRTGECRDEAVKEKILKLNRMNKFKLEPVPVFPYEP